MKTLELVVDILTEWGYSVSLYRHDNSNPYVAVRTNKEDTRQFCDILSVGMNGQYIDDGVALSVFLSGQGHPIDVLDLSDPDSIDGLQTAVMRASRISKAPNRYSAGIQGIPGVTGPTGVQGAVGAMGRPVGARVGSRPILTSRTAAASKPSPLAASSLSAPRDHPASGKSLREALMAKGRGSPSPQPSTRPPN